MGKVIHSEYSPRTLCQTVWHLKQLAKFVAQKGQSVCQKRTNGLQKKRDIAEKASCLLKTDNAVVFSGFF